MQSVSVLLSLYNPKIEWLKQQIDSIFSQTLSNLFLIIRDDGSDEEVLFYIKKLLSQYQQNKIFFFAGKNVGVSKSFFELLSLAKNTDYFAFCDQDDVWHSYKLENSIKKIHPYNNMPCLYASSVTVVDEKLNIFGNTSECHKPSFQNALTQNIANGCTYVFNSRSRDVILSSLPDSSKIFLYDHWIYLVISAFGSVIFDPLPSLLYRQHENNVIGMNPSFLLWLRKLPEKKRNRKISTLNQINEFRKHYYERCSEKHKRLINDFLASQKSFFKRFCLIFTHKIYRTPLISDIVFKIFFMFNKIW